MISAADAALVERERDLPGLAMLLDVESFGDRLRRALPGVPITSVTARYVRYKPATSCLVAYRVGVAGVEHELHAVAWRPGADELAPRFEKAESRRLIAGPLGEGLLRWDDVPAAIWSFPNDLEVRALPRLGTEAGRRRLLWRLARHRPELGDSTLVQLAYKPGRRFVAQLTTAAGARAVIKLYSRSAWAATSSALRQEGDGHRFRSPPLVGRSERHRAALYDWLPGELLIDLVRGAGPSRGALEAAGAALAELHATACDRTAQVPRRPGAGDDESLAALAESLDELVPERSGGIAQSARLLVEALRLDAAAAEGGLVHGDLHAKQIVVDKGRIGFLDFDRARCGAPAEDLGNLLGHFERDGVTGRLSEARAAEAGAAVLDGYRAGGGRLPAEAMLARQRAAALLRLAVHPFRNRESDWNLRIAALLDAFARAAHAGGVRG